MMRFPSHVFSKFSSPKFSLNLVSWMRKSLVTAALHLPVDSDGLRVALGSLSVVRRDALESVWPNTKSNARRH